MVLEKRVLGGGSEVGRYRRRIDLLLERRLGALREGGSTYSALSGAVRSHR